MVAVLTFNVQAQRTVDVDDFDEITFGIPGKLYVKQGSEHRVEVDASDDAYEDLRIETSGSHLKIKTKGRGWSWGSKNDVTVYVTLPILENLAVSGSGKAIGEGTFDCDDVQFLVSGSGNLEMDVEAREVAMKVSGSGEIEVSGNAKEAEMVISGSGKVKAEDLSVDDCEVVISGSGKCYITANEKIDATISGSGDVYYRGNPSVDTRVSGSGSVKKM